MSARRVVVGRRLRWGVAALCLMLVLSGGALVSQASAAGSSIAIISDSPNPQPSGQASTYTINFTCSAVSGNTCGTNPTITIPLDLTSSNPATPAMSTWAYSTSSSISGLIAGGAVSSDGLNYVITLNESKLNPGDSDTIALNVTPPNNITPDATTWSLDPAFSTDAIPAITAPTPATGGASAAAMLSVTKNTNDGGSVYVVGNNVIYNITARCDPGGSTGNLSLTDGSLVDTLPPDLTFVSASPAPTSAPGVGSSGAITWSYPGTSSLPAGCAAGATGSTSYTVVALLDSSTPNNTSVPNPVTFSGTPIGSLTPATRTATKTITAVATPPTSPGTFVGKSSLGPLNIPGVGFHGTYAGHWLPTINPRPNASSPGAAEGEYTVSISYPASRAFRTDLADPVPCLTNPSGVVYSSSSPSGAINGAGSIDNLCQSPAFDPTVVQVNSASLGLAVNDDAWSPIGVRPDGSTFNLTLSGSIGLSGTSAYFEIPPVDVGQVAAIELPPDANLTDISMSMNVWGYADSSLIGGDVVDNVATATAYPVSGPGSPVTSSHSTDLYIEPSDPQLGVFKSFGALGAAPGGTTALNLQGTLATNSTPTGNVILTDLLPFGLSWHNPVASAGFSVSAQQGVTANTVTGTVSDISNFNSTGRELIRIDLPASAFSNGFYTITPPSNFIEIAVPSAATTYNNTDQLFIQGIGQGTSQACGPGTGQTASTFESSDPLGLAGDGQTSENYCQYSASLTVPPSGGPAFTLIKSVQGDLDPGPKFAPGIGDASPSGSGIYTLQWSNTGGQSLSSPVVYDILPYISDTGVSENQAGVPRGSQFETSFAGISGSLPGGVTVAYSESTNPCRPEVFPNADNPSCVNDWSTTAPGDLSLVRAVRFTASGTYAAGSNFSVSLSVNVPPGYVNTVAWNSAASDASFNGSALLPSEPPKVGLTAPAPAATPTLATAVSSAEVQPGDAFTDAVTVGATGGGSGTLNWSLVGPVPAAADGTCAGLDWNAATTLDSGTLPVSGDGAYTTPASAPTQAGCYSYVEQLTGSVFSGPANSAAGGSGETVLVHAAVISTTVSSPRILPGGSATDAVSLVGPGVGAGMVDWSLVGPVTPAPDGTCDGLGWTGASTVDHGTFSVAGAGSYRTPSTSLATTGCYSYVQQLTSSSVGGPATSAAGGSGETVLVAQPQLVTSVSSAAILTGGTISDEVIVSGTGGAAGSLAWSLVGPVAPVSRSCAAADWSSAATLAHGTIDVASDGIYPTPASTVSDTGCYGFAVTLTGASYGAPVSSPAGAAGEVVTVNAAATAAPHAVRVSVTKRVNAQSTTLGQNLTYTLTVKNTGPATATNVTVIDTPKARMKLVSAAPSSGHCTKRLPLICTIGTLRSGKHASIAVVAKPLEPGAIVNTAHVETTQVNSAPATSTVGSARARVLLPPLTLTKTAAQRSVLAGQNVTYHLAVTNPTAVAVRKVTVCDELPSALIYVRSSPRARLSTARYCWTIPTLAARTRQRFTVVANAALGNGGTVVNRATAAAPGLRTAHASAGVKATRAPSVPCASASLASLAGTQPTARHQPTAAAAC